MQARSVALPEGMQFTRIYLMDSRAILPGRKGGNSAAPLIDADQVHASFTSLR